MSSPKIFITGVTGLLGSHIARLLRLHGYTNIIAIRRKSSNLSLLGPDAEHIQWVEGDVLDTLALDEAMEGVDWVIHSAGMISYHPGHAEMLHRVNVEGTANVVNAALRHGVKKFLHVSSVSVLARSGRSQHVTEATPWQKTRYTSNYGLSKHLAEKEVQRGIAEGLNASIIIPSIVLGAGVWQDGSATIFYRIHKGMPFYTKGQNGYVDVRDVALLSMRLLEQEDAYRVIVNGHTIGYKTLFTEIASRIGAKTPQISVGPLASEIVWRLMVPMRWITGRQPVINKETTRAAQCFPEYDNSASLRVPGFHYTPLGQTLDDIAQKFNLAKEKKFAPEYLEFPANYLP